MGATRPTRNRKTLAHQVRYALRYPEEGPRARAQSHA